MRKHTFLQDLFGRSTGYINLWRKLPGHKGGTSTWYELSGSHLVFANILRDAQQWDRQGHDIYFAVCTGREKTGPRSRLTQATAAQVPAYFIDVDTLEDRSKETAGKQQLPASRDAAYARLQRLPHPPSVCVDSGHGLHAYWLLETPIPISDPTAVNAALKRFAQAVAQYTGWTDLDTHASECARVLRVPGTHNHKQEPPLPVLLRSTEEPPARYDAALLDQWAEAICPATKPASKPKTQKNAAPDAYSPGGRYYLTNDQILDRISRRHGADLFNGFDGGDASGGDQALANDLAFYTGGDPARMDEIFRTTGRYRDKWDQRHSADGRTYGEMTIARACADTHNHYCGGDYVRQQLPEAEQTQLEIIQQRYYEASDGEYQTVGFATVAVKTDKSGATASERLCDFIAVPTEMRTLDDGVEQSTEYVLHGYDFSGKPLPQIAVRAKDLPGMRWVPEKWPRAVVEPGTSKPDKLRAALQRYARTWAAERRIYVHTGWTHTERGWAFLHAGGAVGAPDISVELRGKMCAYRLPDNVPDAKAAARASFDLLQIAPLRITAPLLSAMYLAPLYSFFKQGGEAPASILVLKGRTQSKKSVVSALFLSHFGAFTYQTLPLNFQSTANAICNELFALKDVPAVVDDFHPVTTCRRGGIDEMTAIFQRLCRAVGDDASRTRMQSDGRTMQADRPARGIVLVTAEYMPALGESGESRCVLIPFEPGDIITGSPLDMAQQRATDGLYAAAMRGYIEGLIPRADDLSAILSLQMRELRTELQQIDPAFHRLGRLGTSGAFLILGLRWALEYFSTTGAITPEEAQQTFLDGRNAILSLLKEFAEGITATDPVVMFAQLLDEIALLNGALITPQELAGTPNFVGFQTDTEYFIKPQLAYSQLKKLCPEFPISARELWRRLHTAGAATQSKAGTHHIPGSKSTQHCIRLNRARLAELCTG